MKTCGAENYDKVGMMIQVFNEFYVIKHSFPQMLKLVQLQIIGICNNVNNVNNRCDHLVSTWRIQIFM